jgi:hypothetical protein
VGGGGGGGSAGTTSCSGNDKGAGGGGGGGSSDTSGVTAANTASGVRTGDGQVVICYAGLQAGIPVLNAVGTLLFLLVLAGVALAVLLKLP